MRISQKNVHSRGTQSDQSPSSQRTSTSVRITKGFAFPKSLRILKRAHFKAISQERRRHVGNALVIDYRRGKRGKLGITTPRTYGISVERNLFKRRVREAFRRLQPDLPPLEIVVFPKKEVKAPNFQTINDDLRTFYAEHAAAKSC